MIVDYALYQNGLRYKEPSNIGELISKAKTEGGFVWLGLAEPTAAEFDKIMGDFQFHPLAYQLFQKVSARSYQSGQLQVR